ncbi:hypothetical protein CMO90_02220 [Candidatus Woesearchaeota archaeon]|jgi:hypothetical protein|nr:hypothetical protein [Candidatus Woesearchaeota archaeon]|tara:strand:+ start:85 stop:561 length:477 start_codon:yes stop_codon:yes gene_type:complete
MKKHFEKYFLFGFLILAIVASLLVFFGFTFSTNENTGKIINTAKTIVKEEQGFKLISSGSTGQGEVSVDLKPHNVKDGTLKVDISVNTHSVNLEQFNLNEITILEFDDKVIKPISAPSLSGHHNSGTLVFNIGKNIEKFTIKITGIPKVEERIFNWQQ